LTENPLVKLVLHLVYLRGPFLAHCSSCFSSMTLPVWCHLVQPLVSAVLVYREIKTGEDQVTLQRDLSVLVTWAKIWGMQFNPAKCNVMRFHRLQSAFLRTYEFSGTTLAEVEQAKYLGITLSDKLDWEAQVDNITKKASNTLNYLKRNLKY